MNPTREHEDEPEWLRIARREHGIREVKGPEANKRILEYFTATRLIPAEGDETSWCAAFVSWCIRESRRPSPARAMARAFLTYGSPLTSPRIGAIAVLSRGPNPKHGHVGFWLGETQQRVLLLGGNQGNCVSVVAYPTWRVVGYRWP